MLITPHSDWQCKVLVISFSLSLHSILRTKCTWKLKKKNLPLYIFTKTVWFLLLFRKEHQKLQEKLKAVESKIIVGGENLVCIL